MGQDWMAFLATQGARDNAEHFGDPAGELAAARDGAVIAALPDLGLIRASGEEAATFLHNLLTNDVKGLGLADARFAGFCTAKGRLIASFHIWREGGDYLLLLSRDILPAILKKLSMYVLRSKVKLTDASDEIALIGIGGDAHIAPELGRVIRLDDRRRILALPAEAAPEAWARLAAVARPVGQSAWRWLEITAGQPRIVAGTQEAFVPQMVNMELPAVGGVSFTKGCYPGQEIVARTQYLGKIKRRMFRARMENPALPGTHVFAPETGDQHCGALVMAAPSPEGGHECLVVAQLGCVEAGELHVGAQDGPRLALHSMPYPVE